MNINLQTRADYGINGAPVVNPEPGIAADEISRGEGTASLTITKGTGSVPDLTAPGGRPELDPAAPGGGQISLNQLSNRLRDLGNSLRKPPEKPVTPSKAIEAGFNLVALLDLLSKSTQEVSKFIRETKIQERRHKAAVQESTAEKIRATGEISARNSRIAAGIGLGTTIVQGALSGAGMYEQYKAYKQSDVKLTEVSTKETADQLKEVKDYKDVSGAKELLGSENGAMELPAMGEDGKVAGACGFSGDVVELSGKVHGLEQGVTVAQNNVVKSGVDLNGAAEKLKTAKATGVEGDITKAGGDLSAKQSLHDTTKTELREAVDKHIDACQKLKGKMDEEIGLQEQELAKAKTDPSRAGEVPALEQKIGEMKATRDKELFKMKAGFEKSLDQKILDYRNTMGDQLREIDLSEEMSWARRFEGTAGILRQVGEATQGFERAKGEQKEAVSKSIEHLSQSAEARVDSDLEATSGMDEKCKEVRRMIHELRVAFNQIEGELARSIFK